MFNNLFFHFGGFMSRSNLFKIIMALIVIIAVAVLYFNLTPHIHDLNQNISYGHSVIYDIDSQEEYDFYTYAIKASLDGFKEYADYRVVANFTDENGTVLAEDDHVFALSSTNDGKDFKIVEYESKNKKLDVDHCDFTIFDMYGNSLCSASYKFNTSDMEYVGTRETIVDIS